MKKVFAIAAAISLITCFAQAQNATPAPKPPPAIPKPPPPGQPPPRNQVVLPPPVQSAPRTIPQRIENPQVRDFRDPLPPPKQQGLTPLDRVGPSTQSTPMPQPPSNPSQQLPPSGVGPTYKQ